MQIKEFNYEDYLEYERLKLKEFQQDMKLCEEGEVYHLHQPHDKLFKIVLSQKSQTVELLNRMLNLKEKLKEDDIEKYESKHINYMFQNRESDIVYKMKQKNIFFLIEHQRKIDYNMPQRILEYEVEIIKEATSGNKMTKKNHKLPRVIPIVIYTGERKWDVEKYIEECQEVLTESNRVKLGEYYILDVNDYTKEELQKDDLFLSKMLLLERLKTQKEILEVLNSIIEEEHQEENKIVLKKIIPYIFQEKLDEKDIDEILVRLEKEEKNMITEVLRKESEKQRRIGIREGVKQGSENVIIQMLKFGIKEETICKAINITKDDIEKIKNKM